MVDETMLFKTEPCPVCRGTGTRPDRRDVGTKMRQLRLSRKLGMREVARKLGLSGPYISDLELGKRLWNEQLIERFKKACK